MRITKFGISNFRIFKNHFDFELAPITVLTGPNNSGKSSLTKALLLLKENQNRINDESRTTNFFDYSGGQHYLGDHKLVVNTPSENTSFSFSYFQDYKIILELNNEGQLVNDYQTNNRNNELVLSQSSGVTRIDIPNIIEYFKDHANYIKKTYYPSTENPGHPKHGFFRPAGYHPKQKTIETLIHNLEEFSDSYKLIDIDLHDAISLTDEEIEIKNEKAENTQEIFKCVLNLESDIVDLDENSIDLFLWDNLRYLFHIITDVKLSEADIIYLFPATRNDFIDLDGLLYIHTIKEALKRTYSAGDNLIVKSLIQKNLTKTNFENINKINIDTNESDSTDIYHLDEKYKNFISKWLKVFGIAKELVFGYDEEYHLYYIKLDNKSLLENGLGISQLVYLLLAIGSYTDNSRDDPSYTIFFPRTIIIEEPETGLHPDFQSKVAEMIVEARKIFGVSFIIETHSEYFIRKLQLLTAQKELTTADTIIYYFNIPEKIDEREDQVKEIRINEFGSLSDNFGPGFIDEGISLKFELLRLNQGQKN